jgi:hypothetical protein
MKKQYMRLFRHKDDTMPADSFTVGIWEYVERKDVWEVMDDWMSRNPDGKIDFVYLP